MSFGCSIWTVVAYERAILVLSLARLLGSAPSAERVQFRHDPVRLLEALGAGERPSGVPERECSFVATLGIDKAVQWVPVLTMMARGDF